MNDKSVGGGFMNGMELTKKEYFAALALQGFLASPTTENNTIQELAQSAVLAAEALMEELDLEA
jgi:hypothetical protein